MSDPNINRIEYTVLGAVLADPSRIGSVVASVAPEDFSVQSTRGLYSAMCALHLRGDPIDQVTVLHEAGSDYELVVEEALRYNTSDIDYYCTMLKQCSRLQQIQGYAVDLYGASSLEQADGLISSLNRVMMSRRNAEVMSAKDASRDFLRVMASKEKPVYMKWGIPKLDEVLMAELGDFIVIGGYPSAGKSLLAVQLVAKWAETYRVGYFSLEGSNKKIRDRIMCHLAQVPLGKIKRREFDPGTSEKLVRAARKLETLNVDFIRASGWGIRDIQAKALADKYQIIIVDYLQLGTGTQRSRYEEVTAASIALHNLASGHDIMVVALAQLSRPDTQQGKPVPPSVRSLKESGQIEQDADIIMLLWPDDPNNNDSPRNLKVGKNKEGPKGHCLLDFRGDIQTFLPVQPSIGQQIRNVTRQIKGGNAQQSMFHPVSAYGTTPFDDQEAKA